MTACSWCPSRNTVDHFRILISVLAALLFHWPWCTGVPALAIFVLQKLASGEQASISPDRQERIMLICCVLFRAPGMRMPTLVLLPPTNSFRNKIDASVRHVSLKGTAGDSSRPTMKTWMGEVSNAHVPSVHVHRACMLRSARTPARTTIRSELNLAISVPHKVNKTP